MPVSSVSSFLFRFIDSLSSVNLVVVQLPALLRQLKAVVLTQQLHRVATPLLPMLLHPLLALLLLPNRSSPA